MPFINPQLLHRAQTLGQGTISESAKSPRAILESSDDSILPPIPRGGQSSADEPTSLQRDGLDLKVVIGA